MAIHAWIEYDKSYYKGLLLLLLAFWIALFESVDSLNQSSFPAGFVFGAASSAFQNEGAAFEGGRGPSIWDNFTHTYPDRIADHSNIDVANDFYHRYKEDIGILKDIGFQAFRFSISWSRILPSGKGRVNKKGITYYNNLINELLSNGLQPYITLFHWDLPQALEDEYGGFLSPKIVQDFAYYAELCFSEFGDRVKHWITLNEPYVYSISGYAYGQYAPGRCSKWFSSYCTLGDSSTEPYIVAHHQILAHATAVKIYREKYQISQKGQIGITLNAHWYVPLTQSKSDKEAASRILAFMYDWFMEPLYSGTYPVVMVNNVGKRLPKFSRREHLMVKGSFDFIGLNYYAGYYATNAPCPQGNLSAATDSCTNSTSTRNGRLIGPKAASDWLYIYPRGIQDLLEYIKKKFNDPIIYITENGVDEVNDGKKSLDDKFRINYFGQHLLHVQKAIRNGVKVKGYFAWSFLDNFEASDGYTVRFGMIYIDYKNGLKRYRKKSSLWFKKFLNEYNIGSWQ